ncbi:M48 family metalloprotease [Streptomyces huasconensis]|uniref:M48 family metalloprotease n=1 Tax=Streptomyces huasconensis TaxID=1854574 RepID=UPI0036F8C45B
MTQPPEPRYPEATPPRYPTPPAPALPPPRPPAAPDPSAPPGPPEGGDPAGHPHHISTDQRRIHLAAHQRGADATAIGNLLLHVPNFLCSLAVVVLVSFLFGDLGFVVVLGWLASGLLAFHRPSESAIARHLLRLRYPTQEERARLEPVWREVTARAGVEGRTYELWVEDSDSLNAVAAAGHIVGVTSFAMNHLPNGELAAVMAHELGHHIGGHAWSSLLGYWYALPGRLAWRLIRGLSAVAYQMLRAFSCVGIGIALLLLGTFAVATITTLYGLPLLILAIPYALAAVGRRAELRADRHAAALGFAPMLVSVLDKLHRAEQQETARPLRYGVRAAPKESPLSRLLSSHPDHYTRLHHLQPYLRPKG